MLEDLCVHWMKRIGEWTGIFLRGHINIREAQFRVLPRLEVRHAWEGGEIHGNFGLYALATARHSWP
jgi:hypothetical protein